MRSFNRIVYTLFSIMAIAGFVQAEPATLHILVGSFSSSGAEKKGIYGEAHSSDMISQLSTLLKVPDGTLYPESPQQIVQVKYYGDTAPAYYSEQDIAEVEILRGTPRYALIAAKFIKKRLQTTGADQVYLFATSYGGLISRYLIEHNLEGLAEAGKITRWLTVEGAVCGAYPANATADPLIRDFMIYLLGLNIDDPLTMHYKWVERNINKPHYATSCPHFKNILIGHQISTDDNLRDRLLTLLCNRPNDGTLLLEDMRLHDIPEEYRFHGRMPLTVMSDTNHKNATKNDGVIADIATFFRSNRRVTMRIIKARADYFDESIVPGPGEIVFQSRIDSPFIAKSWWGENEISSITAENHAASVIPMDIGQEKDIEVVLFDWMVNPEERSLKLELSAVEIDWDDMYGISEDILNPTEDLGKAILNIPVQQAGKELFHLKNDNWQVWLEVEIYDYSQ